MEKTKYLLLGTVFLFSVFSCQDDGFEREEQIMTKSSDERSEDESVLYWEDIDGV